MPDAAEKVQYDYWNDRWSDGGPIYVETDFSRVIVEPCNAITAFLFVIIVLVWLWRMRGQYRKHPFTLLAMPVLLAGGIGGTIYHALRIHRAFFLLDVIPIGVLVAMGSLYLWIRLRPRWWHVLLLAIVILGLPSLFVMDFIPHHVAIVIHYIMLAALILIPVGIVLVRTKGRHGQLIKFTLTVFGLAVLFRYIDPLTAPILPGLGTHWLWHTGGAITTALLAEYFYRLETETIPPLTEAMSVPAPSQQGDESWA